MSVLSPQNMRLIASNIVEGLNWPFQDTASSQPQLSVSLLAYTTMPLHVRCRVAQVHDELIAPCGAPVMKDPADKRGQSASCAIST